MQNIMSSSFRQNLGYRGAKDWRGIDYGDVNVRPPWRDVNKSLDQIIFCVHLHFQVLQNWWPYMYYWLFRHEYIRSMQNYVA